MRIKFLLLLLFLILIGGMFVPKLLIQDSKELLQEEVDCAKTETHLMLDNPFERILVQGLAVSGKDGESIYVDAYTFWGIKYVRVRVVCNESANVVWRLGRKTIIDSFEDCAAAGYSVAESDPRRCYAPDNYFVEDISLPTEPLPTENPGDTVCTMEAKQCPDGSYVGRVSPSCEFAPCPGE